MPQDDLLDGTLMKETPGAFLINYEKDEQWIPRSIVSYILKEAPDSNGWRKCKFKLPGWKAKQLGWD